MPMVSFAESLSITVPIIMERDTKRNKGLLTCVYAEQYDTCVEAKHRQCRLMPVEQEKKKRERLV
jgi:hypothetical protein